MGVKMGEESEHRQSKVKNFYEKHIKPNLGYWIIMVVLVCIVLNPLLVPNDTYTQKVGDWRQHQATFYHVYDAITKEQTLPLWTSVGDSGTPFCAIPDKQCFYIPTILMGLIFGPVTGFNYSIIIHIILAGIFMFILTEFFTQSKRAAFVAGLLYMFNPFLLTTQAHWKPSFMWLPLILFLIIKAFREKNWLPYTLASAICLTIFLYSGAIFMFYYFCIFLAFFFMYDLITHWSRGAMKKKVLIALVIGILLLGFSLVKILPFMEWSESINRAQGLSIDQARGKPLALGTFVPVLIMGYNYKKFTVQLGAAGFMLLLMGLWYVKKKPNKYLVFLIGATAANIIFAWGIGYNFFYEWLPGLKVQRGIIRSLFLYAFTGSIIAGFGTVYLLDYAKEKLKGKKMKIAYAVLVIVVLVNIIVFSSFLGRYPVFEPFDLPMKENNFVQFLEERHDPLDPYRFHVFDVKGIDFNDINEATVPLGLEDIYHQLGAFWIPEYFHNFLALKFINPANSLGVLNVKYISSSKEINASGLEFVEKLEEWPDAAPDFIDGPYVYENKNVLPRTFTVDHGILMIGRKDQANEVARQLIVQPWFDIKKIILITGDKEKVDDYSLTFLRNFDGIIVLEGSITKNSYRTLQQYKDEGGVIFPDVTAQETQFNIKKLQNLTQSLPSSLIPLKLKEKRSNSRAIQIGDKKGTFLVISEKLHMFPGWKVSVDDAPTKLLRADAVISAIILPENAKQVEFSYMPSSYRKGIIAFIITLILLILMPFIIKKVTR